MGQNIYDNPAFFANYAQLPRSQQGLAGAPEWEAIAAMLPPLQQRRIIDLGCGYGWFCRYARERGAGQVVGVDLSARMLARAAQMTDDSGITYQRADFGELALSPESFDLAYSSLALHYLPALEPLFSMIYRALTPGGSLVFSTEHPIFTCSPKQGWLQDEEGERYWGVCRYQDEGRRTSNWLAEGVIKYHRTLGTTLNALLAAGFQIRYVNEWGPDARQIADNPALAEEAERPMLLLISAQKPV